MHRAVRTHRPPSSMIHQMHIRKIEMMSIFDELMTFFFIYILKNITILYIPSASLLDMKRGGDLFQREGM